MNSRIARAGRATTVDAKLSVALLLAVAFAAALACHERPQTRFPHELHLAGLECGGPGQPPCLTCTSCHRDPESRGAAFALGDASRADDATARRAPVVPAEDRCSSCHGQAAAQLLHQIARPKHEPAPLAYEIRFDHQRHLAMDSIRGQCIPCHTGALDDSSELFPPMPRCFECHEHEAQFKQGQCAPCHDEEAVRKLVPRTFVRHDESFRRHHGSQALRQPELCESCHAQQQCDDCHDMTQTITLEARMPDAVGRQWTHPADFLTRHALEARSQPARCATCHKPETCDGCHLERGVSALGIGGLSPHPPGWVGGNPASRDFHGRAARRDLLSCASCHDHGPATNCIDCHRVGGTGGNPHPRGRWTGRTRASTMCRYCHVE